MNQRSVAGALRLSVIHLKTTAIFLGLFMHIKRQQLYFMDIALLVAETPLFCQQMKIDFDAVACQRRWHQSMDREKAAHFDFGFQEEQAKRWTANVHKMTTLCPVFENDLPSNAQPDRFESKRLKIEHFKAYRTVYLQI